MKIIKLISTLLILAFGLAACGELPGGTTAGETLEASGIVETVEVMVSAEIGGRVAEVFVEAGEAVAAGDALIALEDDLLAARRAQVEAALGSARANLRTASIGVAAAMAGVEAAELQIEVARVQYELQVWAAQASEAPARAGAWALENPEAFELPVWYFDKTEAIKAAEAELHEAAEAHENERANFTEILDSSGKEGLMDAEVRLAEARAAFTIAQILLDREVESTEEATISEFVQNLYDAALAELESAQRDYEQLLSEQDAAEILEARGRLAVAKARHELALDQLQSLQTGVDSPGLRAAELLIAQAEAGLGLAKIQVELAEAAVGQAGALAREAQAALEALDAQAGKLTVYAPIDGVVLVRSVQPGEIIAPGSPAMVLGDLDDLRVTVYVAEDQYGRIRLGETVEVRSDSFPGRSFEAEVMRIADQAEFTPRNVQTQEDRSTTVYAVELSVKEAEGGLKPGMPVDVRFGG